MLACALVNPAVVRALRVALHPAVPSVWTDLFVLAYAAFSVVSQLTSIAGGTPRVLVPAVVLIGVATAGLVAFAWWRRPAWVVAYIDEAAAPPPRSSFTTASGTAHRRVAGAALVVAVAFVVTGSPWLAWLPTLLGGLAAGWYALRTPVETRAEPEESDRPWMLGAVYACGLLGAALALLVVRPRSDDAFYLSVALSVIEAADKPLLAVNAIHGPPSVLLGAQAMFPPYRVHSFEVLGGTLSQLFSVDPAVLIHLVLGPLLSFFAPFAIARALRLLTPAWAIGLLAVIAFYCIEGTASVGYANHAFVRMFHGKSVLLTAGVPLLIVHGVRFGQAPSKLRFLLLLAVQITAVGLSSTAIWLAPIIAMVAVWAGAPSPRELPRRALAAAASSGYVLALGVWVALQISAANAAAAATMRAEPVVAAATVPASSASAAEVTPPGPFGMLQQAVDTALGPRRTAITLLCLMPLALVVTRSAVTWRLLAWLLCVAAALASPFASELVSGTITGVSTYHRLFWLLPIPLALGVAIAEATRLARARFAGPRAVVVAFALLAVVLLVATQRAVLSAANHADLVFPPALKIGPRAREAALAACKRAGEGKYILASSSVSEQIATLKGCGHPVLTVARWMTAPPAEIHRREELVRYVSTSADVPADRGAWFLQGLAVYHPQVVITLEEAMKNRRMKALLRRAGYDKAEVVEGNHLWVRSSKWQLAEYGRVAVDVCRLLQPSAIVLAPFGVSRELRERHCVQPLLETDASSYDERQDRITQFERMISAEADLDDADAMQVVRLIAEEHIGAVVVAPLSLGNVRLRATLRDLGFRDAKLKGGHRLYFVAAAGR